MGKNFGYLGIGVVAGCLFTIFYFKPPVSTSDWASWVQALGSIGAILCAVWVLKSQSDASAIADKIQTKNMLKALYAELDAMAPALVRFSNDIAGVPNIFIHKVANLVYPHTQVRFYVFEGCAHHIGKIFNDELRAKIIRAYAEIGSVYDGINTNSAIVQSSPIGGEAAERRRILSELGPKIRQQLSETLELIENVKADIKSAL